MSTLADELDAYVPDEGTAVIEPNDSRHQSIRLGVRRPGSLISLAVTEGELRRVYELLAERYSPTPSAVACQDCGSTDLETFAHKRNRSGVVDGRLAMHEIGVDVVLGCRACSATVATVDLDELLVSIGDTLGNIVAGAR